MTQPPPSSSPTPTPTLPADAWLAAFDELTPARLHALLALRQRVFIIEQRCLYLDADRWDPEALHLGFGRPPELLACARIFLPEPESPWASFGRVATAPEHRGTGLGKRLVQTCLDALSALAPGAEVRIEAQRHLERFYRAFGFIPFGEPFVEDGIPHIHMARPAPAL